MKCHLCNFYTDLTGCDHYGPKDYDKNKEIIQAVVQSVHGGNKSIIETTDFKAGINATLIYLRKNDLIKLAYNPTYK